MAVIYAFIKGTFKNVHSKLFVRKKYSNHRRNRHYFSANGPFLLLPLALKWGLFGTLGVLAFLFTPLMITPKAVVAAEVPYITLTVPSNPLNLTVSPNDALAETSSTDSAKITVSSNTYWGYTLSLTGDTDDGSLTSADNNKLATFSDDGAISTNTWGFKFQKQNAPNPGDDKWLPGPKKDTLSVLDTTTSNSNGANKEEQATYEFTLGAKVDTSQPAGQYSNTFTFTATVNAASYTINYDDNNGDGGPDKVTGQTQENVVALSTKEPTKADNIFMGWCDQPTTDKNCSGNRYQPGDEITVSRSNSDLTLYAIWHDNKMQNFDGCQYLPMNKQITLVDSRDNKPYYVAKLADENCWMTENLDLDIKKGTKYTVEDTDLAFADPDDIKACTEREGLSCADENGKYVWTPDKSTYTDGTWDSTEASNTNDSTKGNFIAQSYDPGDLCWNGIFGERLNNNGEEFMQNHTVECNKHQRASDNIEPNWHFGNYYNYGAAAAQNNTSQKVGDGESYGTSICPAGWMLPTRSGKGSFDYLFAQAKAAGETVSVGTNGNIHKAPYYLSYAGWWRGAHNYVGYTAPLIVDGIKSIIKAFQFAPSTTSLGSSGGSLSRIDAIAIRCVARRN